MPFTRRQSLAAAALGILTDVLVITLGATVPPGDPLRDSVDNSLLMLGGCGLLIVLLVPRSRPLDGTRATRVGLGTYGALSLAAILLTDFGAWRRTGLLVKALAGVLFLGAGRALSRPD